MFLLLVRRLCMEVTHVLMILLLLQLGSTAIGLKTKDGVVLAVEKRVTSPLLVFPLYLLLFFYKPGNLLHCIVTNCTLGYSVENMEN
jgi:hypothetical protein